MSVSSLRHIKKPLVAFALFNALLFGISLVSTMYFWDQEPNDYGVCTEVRYISCCAYREEKTNAYLQHGFYVPACGDTGRNWKVERDVPCDKHGNPDPTDYTEPDIEQLDQTFRYGK